MHKKYPHYIALSIGIILFMINPAMARHISFQPRVEVGVMQYELETEGSSKTVIPGSNQTFSPFKYEDVMPFVSAGTTFFMKRLFVDISGQYAFDGEDTGAMTRSKFIVDSVDLENQSYTSNYIAFSPTHEATFDRTDMAISLGYALTSTLSIFVGYKTAETQFHEKYDGPYSSKHHNTANTDPDDIYYYSGRWWGEATYTFEYAGPFIGFIQGWDLSESRYLKGMLTANVALAFLDGKLKTESDGSRVSVTRINDQDIPEYVFPEAGENLSSGTDTKGDALGLKISLSWNGTTPWEGLSYVIGLSAYRYEFDANETLSNMNETSTNLKVGLSYVF